MPHFCHYHKRGVILFEFIITIEEDHDPKSKLCEIAKTQYFSSFEKEFEN